MPTSSYALATTALAGATVVGTPVGAIAATEGVALSAADVATSAAGSMLMINSADNKSQGYDRGKVSGKNEKHGDSGRSLSKAEKQINALEQKAETAPKKERDRINQRIKNIKYEAEKRRKGEEHSRANKR